MNKALLENMTDKELVEALQGQPVHIKDAPYLVDLLVERLAEQIKGEA